MSPVPPPTAPTLEASTDLVEVSAGSCMRTPLVAILDGAANARRWRELPDLHSYWETVLRATPASAATTRMVTMQSHHRALAAGSPIRSGPCTGKVVARERQGRGPSR